MACKAENTYSLHACTLSHFSHVQFWVALWTPPGSSVHGILQARILEWVAVPSSRGSSQPRDGISVSCLLHCQVVSLPLAPPGKPYGMHILLYICRFFKPSLKNPKYILITMSNFREKNSKNKKSVLEPTRLCLVNVLCSYCYYTSFCIFSSLKDS